MMAPLTSPSRTCVLAASSPALSTERAGRQAAFFMPKNSPILFGGWGQGAFFYAQNQLSIPM